MRWLRVEDASAVAACRKAVQIMAERLEFPAARIGQLALAVTEAASNLHKHAEQGSLLLCVNRDGPSPGLLPLAIPNIIDRTVRSIYIYSERTLLARILSLGFMVQNPNQNLSRP